MKRPIFFAIAVAAAVPISALADETATSQPAGATADTGSEGNGIEALHERVRDLRSRVTRSQAVIEGVTHELLGDRRNVAVGSIAQRNELGSLFKRVKAVYVLDGKVVYSRSESSGELGRAKQVAISTRPLSPGQHVLSVTLVYRGDSSLFTYMRGYRYTVSGSHTFNAAGGGKTQVTVTARERGNPTTALEDTLGLEIRSGSAPLRY